MNFPYALIMRQFSQNCLHLVNMATGKIERSKWLVYIKCTFLLQLHVGYGFVSIWTCWIYILTPKMVVRISIILLKSTYGYFYILPKMHLTFQDLYSLHYIYWSDFRFLF